MDRRCLLLILHLCSGSSAQNRRTRSGCVLPDKFRVDVFILLDGFNHISPGHFSTVKDFLCTLVPMFGPVGPDLVQISLVKNGRDPEAEFFLNSYLEESSVVDAVSRMSQNPPLPGGDTRRAVMFIWREIGKTERGYRPYVPRVFFILTDSNSSGVDTGFLNRLGGFYNTKSFVVGVNLSAELQEYKGETEVFSVDDYSRIADVFTDLTQAICRWIKEKLSEPRPESLRVTGVQSRRAGVSWEWNRPGRVDFFALSMSLYQSGSEEQEFRVVGHRRSTEISNLLPNTKYRFTVSAVYGDGESQTKTVDLTTAPELVRLSRGPGRCSGSVEVKKAGPLNWSETWFWSSVCGSDFGLTEAAVVCAELECGAVSELHQGALFSEDSAVGPSFHCDGAETSLTECKSSEETRCSSAVNLTCSDAVLRVGGRYGFRCRGSPRLRYQGEWRLVSIREEPDLDLLSVLCEQSGCGSAVSGNQRSDPGQHWWVDPECVKQSSVLSDCLDMNLSQNKTNGGLWMLCTGFFPAVRGSVSSEEGAVSSASSEEGAVSSLSYEEWNVSSVSSEDWVVSSVSSEKILVMLGTNFTVSCSLDDSVPMKQLHLLSPTGNYTLPPVSQSAHFLFQNFSSAHMGNYTCVYCDEFGSMSDYVEKCIKSNFLVISPGGGESLTVILVPICLVLIVMVTTLIICCWKRSERGGGGKGRPRPTLRLEEMESTY